LIQFVIQEDTNLIFFIFACDITFVGGANINQTFHIGLWGIEKVGNAINFSSKLFMVIEHQLRKEGKHGVQ